MNLTISLSLLRILSAQTWHHLSISSILSKAEVRVPWRELRTTASIVTIGEWCHVSLACCLQSKLFTPLRGSCYFSALSQQVLKCKIIVKLADSCWKTKIFLKHISFISCLRPYFKYFGVPGSWESILCHDFTGYAPSTQRYHFSF